MDLDQIPGYNLPPRLDLFMGGSDRAVHFRRMGWLLKKGPAHFVGRVHGMDRDVFYDDLDPICRSGPSSENDNVLAPEVQVAMYCQSMCLSPFHAHFLDFLLF
jgi:hypothetical protein